MKSAHEAESAILALCFRDPECHRRATLEVTQEHFSDETLSSVWNAISKHEAPLDLTLVAQTMSEAGTLEAVGGKARLAAFRFNPADKNMFPAYLASLHECRAHRRLARTLANAEQYVGASSDALPVVTARVEDMLSDVLREARITNDGSSISDVLAAAYIESQKASERVDGMVGYRTYFRPVDDMIGGFEPGHVTTLMGEPGSGKTALAIQTALGVSRNVPIGFVSLEMTHADLGQRIQACAARIDFGGIRNGRLPEAASEARDVASADLADTRRFWVAPPTVESWDESVAWMTHMYYSQGVRVFILDNVLSLDYGQLDEYQHVTRVSSASQRFVKKLNVALVNLHHTNTDEKPTLRSAHGAKAIARHSSNVLALWREDPEDTNVMLMELKGRNVGRGERMLRFYGAQQRFTEPLI